MRIIVDNKEIEAKEGNSVLESALDAGIYIPHLCKHPDLEAVGGCRLCSVEVEGVECAVPACKTIVKEGMKITVSGEKAEKTRKMALELILASHPADCTGCPKYGKCELQSIYQYMGVSPEKWRRKSKAILTDDNNPLITHLFTRCIKCGRCVRACRELRGVKVLDYQKTESGVQIGIDGNLSLEEAGCRFCGACIEVCPTGSIMDKVGVLKEQASHAEAVVPCKAACPAHTDIPRYLRYIKNGEYEKATAVIREKLPFPETLGHICTHVCETDCKRNHLGEPISICRLKKAAASEYGENWKQKRRINQTTGKKVAIMGAGPSGMSAAYYLAKQGHCVTIFEANEKAGGQCRYGIPSYRLPDAVLDREISDILGVGIELQINSSIDNPQQLLAQGYDAVLVAIGTHEGIRLPLEGNQLEGVLLNTDFLKQVRAGIITKMEGNIMVLGGGNVAYDCARTALRLGALEVHIACLEDETTMTATIDEREEGKEEGIILHAASSFLRIAGEERVEGVELQKVSKFYFDENRKAVIELVEGSKEMIPVSQVIFAVGQKPKNVRETGLELVNNAYIKVDQNLQTSVNGIFSSGDVVTGTKSVIAAIAEGRKAAEEMDKYLGGTGDISEQLVEREDANPWIGRIPDFGKKKRMMPEYTDPKERAHNFHLVETTLNHEQTACEAERCLQCDLRLQLEKPKLWNEF